MSLMLKTKQYFERMEEIFQKHSEDPALLDSMSDEEKNILFNPMLHLAETIYMDMEGWHGNTWAHKLRDYLNVLCEENNDD